MIDELLQVDQPHLQAYITKAEVLDSLGEHQQVIDTVNEILAINSEWQEKARIFDEMDQQIQEAAMRGNIAEAEWLRQRAVDYAIQMGDYCPWLGPQDVMELCIL